MRRTCASGATVLALAVSAGSISPCDACGTARLRNRCAARARVAPPGSGAETKELLRRWTYSCGGSAAAGSICGIRLSSSSRANQKHSLQLQPQSGGGHHVAMQ